MFHYQFQMNFNANIQKIEETEELLTDPTITKEQREFFTERIERLKFQNKMMDDKYYDELVVSEPEKVAKLLSHRLYYKITIR